MEENKKTRDRDKLANISCKNENNSRDCHIKMFICDIRKYKRYNNVHELN